MRKMDDFGPLVAQAARDRAAFRLTHYAQDLASLFHSFYTNCHVIGEEEAVTNARLALVDATRIVLAKTLDLLEMCIRDSHRSSHARIAIPCRSFLSSVAGSLYHMCATKRRLSEVVCMFSA